MSIIWDIKASPAAKLIIIYLMANPGTKDEQIAIDTGVAPSKVRSVLRYLHNKDIVTVKNSVVRERLRVLLPG
jgi:transcription initiation factor IIE alpha subunit